MNEIPNIYWMIMFGFLASFICLVLLYLALLLKESRDAVKESKEILESSKESILKIGRIINEAENTINIVKNTTEEVSNKILSPVKIISGLTSTISSFIANRKKDEKTTSSESDDISIEDFLNK